VIDAVVFDLDDTLYPQADWLDGAWRAVAARGADDGVDPQQLYDALVLVASEGSDRGRIIDRALERVGAASLAVAPLVVAFRAHAPEHLEPYPGAAEALDRLGTSVPLGLVTDGEPAIQRAKLRALGLESCFSTVILSDEHGREHRKPDPLPFRRALEALDVRSDRAVYVGDRPDKDVAGAMGAGLRAIRVRTGEWSGRSDEPSPWRSVPTVVDAIDVLLGELGEERGQESASTSSRKSSSPGARR